MAISFDYIVCWYPIQLYTSKFFLKLDLQFKVGTIKILRALIDINVNWKRIPEKKLTENV